MRLSILYFTIFCAGFAALSWEVIWQLKLSLSLGFSALGTAITLATTMGGMTLGSLAVGQYLKKRPESNPLTAYMLLEAIVGLSGLGLESGFRALETLDRSVYQSSQALAPLVHVLAGVLLLGLPTLALGATIPVFNSISQRFRTPLSWL